LKVPHQVGDLGGYLKEQRETARLSLRQLASAAGVSNPYLSQIERGLRKPSAEVLQQIAKGLQISAEALFQRAGLLEDAGGVEVEVALQSDVHLTARQKRVLLDIYATFRAENARAIVESGGGSESGAESETETQPGTRETFKSVFNQGANVVPLNQAEELKVGSVKVDGADDGGSTPKPKRARKRAAAKPARASRSQAAGGTTPGRPASTS
jgi:transcriptional regulator with XRE-family HTH domain